MFRLEYLCENNTGCSDEPHDTLRVDALMHDYTPGQQRDGNIDHACSFHDSYLEISNRLQQALLATDMPGHAHCWSRADASDICI
jgi:hypothetical protein